MPDTGAPEPALNVVEGSLAFGDQGAMPPRHVIFQMDRKPMSLDLSTHLCGTVLIVECSGRISAGPEAEGLLAILRKDSFRDIRQIVLHMGCLNRLDSTGLGLLVRCAGSLRQRGGDLRLACVTPPILEIFQITRIDSVLNIYPTEEEAVLSFLQKPDTPASVECSGGCVLLVDQSPDFCAFASALLTQHGFDVKRASLVRDARILLLIEKPNFILAGPSTQPEALDQTLATFKSLAPGATVLAINPTIKTEDPHRAAEILLAMLSPAQ
jgi:anti-sigma B factor antagonist